MEGEEKEGEGEKSVLIEQMKAYGETQCLDLLCMKWP